MKTIKRICMILAFVLCLAVPVQADAIVESENKDVTVDYYVKVSAPDGGVNFRYGAGAEYDKLISSMIPNGTVLHIAGERTANTGRIWGYTEYQGMWGYVALSQTSPCENPEVEAQKKAEKEAAEKAAAEAAEQEALKKEAEEQEALKKEAEEQEALKKEAEEQEALKKEAEEQEALKKEGEEQEALKKETEEQEALKKEDKEQETVKKEAEEQENQEEEQKEPEVDSQDSGMDTGFLIKILVLVGICLIAAVTAGALIVHYKK